MKAVFGIVSLLVALAIVGMLASRQMNAAGVAATGSRPAASNVREQSRQMQEQVRQDVNKALGQGAARQEEADK